MARDIFISGFSTVRNGIKLGYPLVESICSILPVVDEFVISIGKSEDETLEVVKGIGNPKIKIIETVWDPRFTVKGRILAVQSNIALFQCTGEWAFYIQADEVFHDADQDRIVRYCENFLEDEEVEGFLFNYTHFFGNHEWYGDSYHWYRKEIRIIRNHRGIISWRSAQSFRVDGRRIKVVDTSCRIFHYGWVRPPEVMAEKRKQHDRLHHGEEYTSSAHGSAYNYLNEMDPRCMRRFRGEHPAVMRERIKNYTIAFDPSMVKFNPGFRDLKRRVVNRIGKMTNWYPGEYRNYKLLKKRLQ
jgi:glycosyltransferase involved in cell wall biosynthesis